MPRAQHVFSVNQGVKNMTELHEDPADRRPVHRDDGMSTVTDRTAPDLEAPNFATTEVDPTPGGPRPLVAVEPNFATTDVDPTPGSPRPLVAAVEPNFATTDVDPTPGSPPGHEVRGVSGNVAARPAVDTGRPDTVPPRGR